MAPYTKEVIMTAIKTFTYFAFKIYMFDATKPIGCTNPNCRFAHIRKEVTDYICHRDKYEDELYEMFVSIYDRLHPVHTASDYTPVSKAKISSTDMKFYKAIMEKLPPVPISKTPFVPSTVAKPLTSTYSKAVVKTYQTTVVPTTDIPTAASVASSVAPVEEVKIPPLQRLSLQRLLLQRLPLQRLPLQRLPLLRMLLNDKVSESQYLYSLIY